MIYCVWYPSGGFGHFINAVLTLHGNNFVRPCNTLEFSSNGNSHGLDLVVPKYLHGHWTKKIKFLQDKNYCVLIDNGIDSKIETFKSTFLNSVVIKICYSDQSWPVVARTMIEKVMGSSLETQLSTDQWNTDSTWARREKYFLYLRDHAFRHAWRPLANDHTIYIDDLIDYNIFFKKLNLLAAVESFEDTWTSWKQANDQYINPISIAKTIIDQVRSNQFQKLDHIQDTWTQAVVYYYIWITFGIEVPHNEFVDFFTDTNQIMELVA